MNDNLNYSRSHNNVNVVYYNHKEITSSYSVIAECNLSHSLPDVSIILFDTVNFKEHVIFKIVTVIRPPNTSKFLNNVITVVITLHSSYYYITLMLFQLLLYI